MSPRYRSRSIVWECEIPECDGRNIQLLGQGAGTLGSRGRGQGGDDRPEALEALVIPRKAAHAAVAERLDQVLGALHTALLERMRREEVVQQVRIALPLGHQH